MIEDDEESDDAPLDKLNNDAPRPKKIKVGSDESEFVSTDSGSDGGGDDDEGGGGGGGEDKVGRPRVERENDDDDDDDEGGDSDEGGDDDDDDDEGNEDEEGEEEEEDDDENEDGVGPMDIYNNDNYVHANKVQKIRDAPIPKEEVEMRKSALTKRKRLPDKNPFSVMETLSQTSQKSNGSNGNKQLNTAKAELSRYTKNNKSDPDLKFLTQFLYIIVPGPKMRVFVKMGRTGSKQSLRTRYGTSYGVSEMFVFPITRKLDETPHGYVERSMSLEQKLFTHVSDIFNVLHRQL